MEDESIVHCLVSCRVIEQVWNRVGIGTKATQGMTFLEWVIKCFQRYDSETQCLLSTVCWALWGARNNAVWNNKFTGTSNIVGSAKGFLDHWRNAQKSDFDSSSSTLERGDGAEQWTVPRLHSVKVNVDATIFQEHQKFGVGFVARDDKGMLLEGGTRLYHGSIDPILTEVMGMREALSWIKSKQWHQVYVESDCLVIVQAIRSTTEMISPFGKIINDCRTLLGDMQNVVLSFVKRSANMVVHDFARASILYPDRLFSLGDVPADLLPTLVTEFHG
ncbi:uncharacterized protein LOC133785162 [Humulus lupulus]|uniref:uncharacterized protein LOC133785162 n=1 Tax=Humulus lupulus TaxID=3486 RepID=UPI002B415BFF|nr:uncharacterized protein LOC133785162 [Humulus lupulus]